MTYFKTVTTLEELRRQYKELLKKYHPDNANGSTEATQQINAEYDKLFKLLKDRHEGKTSDSDKTTFDQMKYDFSADAKLREVLQKIISFSGIDIDVVGCYIWVDGNTYPYREELKANGFRWSRQRKKWYWHDGEYRKRGNKNLSYEDIQRKFGSTKVQTDTRILLEAQKNKGVTTHNGCTLPQKKEIKRL